MSTTENFLAGSSVNYGKSLFYDILASGECYMGFAREAPMWGFSALVKIEHRSGISWPTDVMGQTGDGDELATGSQRKFYDDNSFRLLGASDEPASGQRVYIRRILATDDVILNRITGGEQVVTGVSTGKLVDTSVDFTNVAYNITVGDTVYNETLGTFATITAIDSATQLSLSSDIMTADDVYQIWGSDESKYTTIDVGTLTLRYMNEEWARIEGLDYDSLISVLDTYDADTYNYYMFNYKGNLPNARVRIETVEHISQSTIQTNVRLMYSTVTDAQVPTTDLGNNLIGDLKRNVNVLGEVSITGLNPSFVTEGSGYIADNSLSNATFFLTQEDSTVIQGDMKYVEIVENDNETSLVLSYPIVNEAIQNSGRISITVTRNSDTLAIFNERFADGQTVTDNAPPPLQLNYLKQGAIHDSIMDVLGLVRIDAADVKMAKRIDTSDTQKQIFGDPNDPNTFPVLIADTTANKDVITMNDSSETETTFVYTTDKDIARRQYFDLIRINKSIPANTGDFGTTKVYRQLFICHGPYIASGGEGGTSILATASSYSNDTTNEIFIEDEHRYKLGTILYIANKKPVFRNHLGSSESFTIFI